MVTTTQEPQSSNQNTALARIDKLKTVMTADSVQAQFKNALAENKDAFVASLIDLYSGDQYLQNCEPALVVGQALKAAVLKLAINKALGHAYIIPYKNSKNQYIPQFQIGYKGMIQLALRTGWYETINVDEVLEGEMVVKNKLTGEFDMSGKATSKKVVGYFAYIRSKTGFEKTYYMTVEQIHTHAKRYSKSYDQQYGPWKTEFPGMAKKTVINYLLSHFGMVSIEMQNSFTDNDADDEVQAEISEKGNKGPGMSFEEATVVPPGEAPGSNQPADSMGFAESGNENTNQGRPF